MTSDTKATIFYARTSYSHLISNDMKTSCMDLAHAIADAYSLDEVRNSVVVAALIEGGTTRLCDL